jgi:Transposase
MDRRRFLKSATATGLAVGLCKATGNASIPEHNWDKYDWGWEPPVPNRLYQGPFPQYGPGAVVPDSDVAMITSPSRDIVSNYGMGLIVYVSDDTGPLRIPGQTMERTLEDLIKLPFAQKIYARPNWREVQKQPGRLDFPEWWKITFDLARRYNKPIGFRVQLENPDVPDPGMPDFLLNKVPYVKLKGEWKGNPAEMRYKKDNRVPQYDHPAYQAAFRELNGLLAGELNGHPLVSHARVDFGGANQPRPGRKEPTMLIVGCDYHPGFQQIAYVDTETGELQERRLGHREETERFYRDLAARGGKVRVGMEASGHARWFERLLAELNFELWIGDAAEIRAKRVRKQKTDRQDAQHILRLLLKDDFPRIWVPSWENRDLRQLLWHRHRMVQTRTRIMNQLQAVALNEGLRCKKRLWRESGRAQLQSLRLAPFAVAGNTCLRCWTDLTRPSRANAGHRAGSREVPPGAALDDPSRSRCSNRISLRADYREMRPVRLWQTDRQLSRSGSSRRLQWRTTTAGTYQ